MKDGIIGNREKVLIEIHGERGVSRNLESMERRIREDRLESENRIEKNLENISKEVKENKKDIENKFNDLSKEVKENNKNTRNISITTIIGIAAMIITIILTR